MRPLLICDADDVLLSFASTFVAYCADQGMTLCFDSFALYGNLRQADGSLVAKEAIGPLVDRFFEERVELIPPLPGAADALAHLSAQADIIILTNVPAAQRTRRETALAALGMPYPVIANEGLKGPGVAALAADRRSAIAFVDDLPYHHDSVFQHAPHVHRLHMVGDATLRRLVPATDHAHARIDDWAQALPHLERVLAGG
jgi:hypothetical protein